MKTNAAAKNANGKPKKRKTKHERMQAGTRRIRAENDRIRRENDPDRVFELPIDDIIISPLNDKIYGPISPDDPDIIALADDIIANGLKVPLILSLDWCLMSGHRRLTACKRIGQTTVKVRLDSVFSTDPEFLPLLASTTGNG